MTDTHTDPDGKKWKRVFDYPAGLLSVPFPDEEPGDRWVLERPEPETLKCHVQRCENPAELRALSSIGRVFPYCLSCWNRWKDSTWSDYRLVPIPKEPSA